MVIIDRELKKLQEEGKPIRVGIIGAGYIGRALAIQILDNTKGMDVVAIYNRTLSRAELALTQAKVENISYNDTADKISDDYNRGVGSYTDNPMAICDCESIDCIVEATGEVEFGAEVTLRAIEAGKHVVLLNAELDAVLGPILKHKADQAGVCITNCDGDQPGVVMNLLRWVDTIGYRPLLAGNIKGMLDHYRNPTTQARFAKENAQQPKMVTSFADGTKLAMEMAVVANATGFGVIERGMQGPACDHANESLSLFDTEKLLEKGAVDYVLGAEPGPGVFVIGYNDNAILKQVAGVLKMGDGPFYCFYVPYHLVHVETPISIARAVIHNDATVAPIGPPVTEVLTSAKIELSKGTTLDGIGGYHAYGLIDNISEARLERALPMSLSEGCVLKSDISKDGIITFDDVIVPEGRLIDKLYAEQQAIFGS